MILLKKIVLFLFILLFAKASYTQETCKNDTDAMKIKGTWKKIPDANMHADKNLTLIINRIDKIGTLCQEADPEPPGVQVKWYRTMERDPLIKDGPVPYQFNAYYYPWYCDDNHNIVLSVATEAHEYAFVNRFGWFVSDQYDLLSIKVNGNNVYLLPPEKGTWKGYTLYQNYTHENLNFCVLLTHDYKHEPLLKPITQEEYLYAVRTAWEAQKKLAIDNYMQYEVGMKKGIVDVQNNKYATEDAKKTIIAGMQQALDDYEKTKETKISESNKLFDDKISVIDRYIKQDSATLQQPAVIDRNMMNDFTGSFSTIGTGGQTLACFNPAYFNLQLPRYVPQFIVLEWRWENKIQGLSFKQQFETNFPIEKLQEMIDK